MICHYGTQFALSTHATGGATASVRLQPAPPAGRAGEAWRLQTRGGGTPMWGTAPVGVLTGGATAV